MPKTIRTIIADDHQIFVEGLKAVFKFQDIEIVGIAYNGTDLVNQLCSWKPELLILDLNLPGKNGIEVLRYIGQQNVTVKVLVLSMYDDPKIVKTAFNNGALGYVLKDQNIMELNVAIRNVMGGNKYVGKGVKVNGSTNGQKILKQTSFFKDDFTRRQYLTKRELEILNLITQAMSNKEIAKELFISDQTVSVHRKNIMRKLGVSNTAGLLKIAYEHSLVG